MTPAFFLLAFLALRLASTAQLAHYGVWRGSATGFSASRGYHSRPTVLALLSIHDGIIYDVGNNPSPPRPRDVFAALDMKAPDPADIRIVYWIDRNFTSPLASDDFVLNSLRPGFHAIPAPDADPHRVPQLDVLGGGLVDVYAGKTASYDDTSDGDDAVDVLHSFFDPAVDSLADVWVWGQRAENGNGLSIHHVRVNQGHSGKLAEENGRFQDGGVVVRYHDHWEALFLAFPQQAAATNEAGEPEGRTLGDVLRHAQDVVGGGR